MPNKSTMITKDSLSKGKKAPNGRGKCNTKGVWVNSNTLYPCDAKHPDAIHFDSWLELKVYSELIAIFNVNGVERQKPIYIERCPELDVELIWRPDFYIPAMGIFVEAKGEWINNPNNGADRTLFTWQLASAIAIAGCDVRVVGEKDFTIGKIEVKDYRAWRALNF